MGHHLFFREGKALPMGDFDVALTRHFLVESANRLENHQLARAISEWDYQGPGVWVGIKETALADQGAVFETAIEIAQQIGELIPVDYLNENVRLPGGRWLKDQDTSDVVARIRKLKQHLINKA